jgi:uncharacterized protein YcnI
MWLRTIATLALAGGLIAVPLSATAHVTLSVDRVGAGEFVHAQAKPGWRAPMTKRGDRVVRVSWRGGRIGPDRFETFGLSARFPEARGRTLAFPAVQTYSSGEVVRWSGPPSAGESAPRVRITQASS